MFPTPHRNCRPARRAAAALLAAACALVASADMHGADSAQSDWQTAPLRISTVAPLEPYVSASVTPDRWKPADQADLTAETLRRAPLLAYEAVAPAPKRCWSGHRPYLVPNPDGKSWDMIFPYYNKYRGEQELVIHDFGTGKTSRQVLSTRTGDSVLTREPIGFHMQPSFYADGKLIFKHYGAVLLTVYDPAADRFVKGVKPFGNDVIAGDCVLGEDGMIYGMGWPADKSGFVAFRFDPKTYQAARSKTFGPPNPHRRELYRGVIMSGDWLYADVGARPWHLVGYNFKTKQGRLLAATKADVIGSGATIRLARAAGGLSGTIQQPAFVDGIGAVEGDRFDFWLREGRILKRDGTVPPWPAAPARREGGKRFSWSREFQVWPTDFRPPSPPPVVERDAAKPDGAGRVRMPYQPGGSKETRTLEYTVKMYPGVVQLLTEVNDHVLFATDSGYGQHVFYDLKTRRLLPVGGTLSPYSIGHLNGRLYVSGYPSSQMYEYDFSRPIGLRQARPNPRRVGFIGRKTDTHTPLAGTMGAADGRVYCAGITYGRRREGGGFGWYDTKTAQVGGEPIDGHRFFWMVTADSGRYVLTSTKFSGEGTGLLFCWDTRGERFLYRKPILGRPTPGPVVEALPGGLLMGHTTAPDGDGGVLYGLRADTGEVLWTKPAPAGPITAVSRVRRHAYSFRRGPDGWIWAFFDKTLVRIDPVSAAVVPLGRVPGDPAQIAFAAGAVYIAGGRELRRLKGIRADVKPVSPRARP